VLQKASGLAPGERAVYAHLAVAYRRSGQPEEARKMMDVVQRINSEERERAAAAIRQGTDPVR